MSNSDVQNNQQDFPQQQYSQDTAYPQQSQFNQQQNTHDQQQHGYYQQQRFLSTCPA